MELNEYQKRAMSTCMESSDNEAYMLTGLTGEVGELNSKIAKLIRKRIVGFEDDNALHIKDEDTDVKEMALGILGEIGDCLWFIAGIARQFGFTLEDVAQYNIDKLASRKQRGVIDGNGDNR